MVGIKNQDACIIQMVQKFPIEEICHIFLYILIPKYHHRTHLLKKHSKYHCSSYLFVALKLFAICP